MEWTNRPKAKTQARRPVPRLPRIDPEIVEVRYRVGARPQAHPAGPDKRIVGALQNPPVVEINLESVAASGYLQNAPAGSVAREVVLHAGMDPDELAVLHLEDHHILLQRAGPRQVVVIGVVVAPYQAAGLYFTAGDWFDAHAYVAIAQAHIVENG